MKLKLSLKNILLSSTILILIAVLLFIFYLTILWGQLPVNKLSFSAPITSQNKISFEEGSIISKSEIKTFYLFSQEKKPFIIWFAEKTKNDEIKFLDKNLLFIKTPFKIKVPAINQCEKNCYQQQISFDNLPGVFWKGLIGVEDSRFLNHFGIDLKSIFRAIVKDILDFRLAQGGSTLTQQLVKNLFLTNEKTITRKFKEIILSIYIEQKLSKEEILQSYFNEVYWGTIGGINIKGIYSAGLIYFSKRPEEITPYEAAILVSLLKGPNFYNPIRNKKRLQARVEVVYTRLISLGLFPDSKEYIWNNKNWNNWIKNLKNRIQENTILPFVLSGANSSHSLDAYEKFIFYRASALILKDIKEKTHKNDFAVKAIIGRPKTGKTFSFYSKFERKKTTAIKNEKHQLGSSLKPILYNRFKIHGKSMNDLVSTKEIQLKLISGNWIPKEAHEPNSPEITLTEALQKSYNRPVVRIAAEIGFEIIEADLKQDIPSLLTPLSEYPAQLLGAIELPLEKVYSLYTNFVHNECTAPDEENILYLLSDPKKTTIKYSADKFIRNQQFFGKTGTSNNGLDNWYIFYDGVLLGVIWVGQEGPRSKENIQLYGSTTAFRVFQHFIRNRGKAFNVLDCETNNQETNLEDDQEDLATN